MINNLSEGQLVISKAGHDKGLLMLVLNVVSDDFVYVVDGITRKFQKPKLKKIKHLQPVKKYIDIKLIYDLNNDDEKNTYIRKQIQSFMK